MQKQKSYALILKQTPEWEPYLLAESGLPGPRANLELVQAVAAYPATGKTCAGS